VKNFLYAMESDDPAPAGDGDTRSWFMFYKWNVDGPSFVPRAFPFLDAEIGDFIWFALDGVIVGGAEITQVETPTLRVQTQELWFNPEDGLELSVPVPLNGITNTAAEQFKKIAKKRK